MQVICPVCRSELEAVGNVDLKAPQISVVKCPVCGAPINIPSGFPVPYKWTSFKIIKAYKPVIAWEDIKKSNPQAAAAIEKPTQENQQSIYKNTSIVGALQESGNAIVGGIKSGLNTITDLAITPVKAISNQLGLQILIAVIAIIIVLYLINRIEK